MDTETKNVIERYEKRKNSELVKNANAGYLFTHKAESERELCYLKILKQHFSSFHDLRLLEIGAGWGKNLYFFKKWGFKWENIYINELLPDRLEELKRSCPFSKILPGDAYLISDELNQTFDIVFQSTVFTSILDDSFKRKLADKMWTLLKSEGIILWYDFAYDNPKNKDVKGVKKKEIKRLFPEAEKITYHKTTLAPPIGRKVPELYSLLNFFPFLRTHLVAVIKKST